jgi:hypothetical protein
MAGSAVAEEVPGIGGHVTDTHRKLKGGDKDAIEEKLGKIQTDTQDDVAAWITDTPPQAMGDSAREAFDQWHIGKDWENGILLVYPSSGPPLVVQRPERPLLSSTDIDRVLKADGEAGGSMRARLDRMADEMGALLRVGAKAPKVRPWGKRDSRRAAWYAVGALVIAAAAALMSIRRRSASRQSEDSAPRS